MTEEERILRDLSGIALNGMKGDRRPMTGCKRLERGFFERDVLEVAPLLLSKVLAIKPGDNGITRFRITETEAYRGEEDLACHASKGRTAGLK